MKLLPVYILVIAVFTIIGCSKENSHAGKISVRPITIAGMPVSDKDYQLSARADNPTISTDK